MDNIAASKSSDRPKLNNRFLAKKRRRRILIKQNIQFRFALVSFCLILASTISVWFLMDSVLQTVFAMGPLALDEEAIFFNRANFILGAVILADCIFVFFLTLYFSNAVAGPIYRLEKALLALVQTGSSNTVTLRKKDLLKETAQVVNDVIEKYGDSPRKVKKK